MNLANMSMDKLLELQPYIDTIIVPVGTVEAHGKHAPLGTDIMIPKHLAKMIDAQISGRVYIAPEIAYGHAWGFDFPGTVNVPAQVLCDYVYYSLLPFRKWGIQNIVLINGHGGNVTALQLAMERLVNDEYTVLLSNWWLDYQDITRTITPGIGHAGEDETSAILAIDASLVDMSKASKNEPTIPKGLRYPGIWNEMYQDAMSGDAAAATKEKGEALLQHVSKRLLQDIMELWNRQK